jgi:hypothetical protein
MMWEFFAFFLLDAATKLKNTALIIPKLTRRPGGL